jgi:hypothetical protein
MSDIPDKAKGVQTEIFLENLVKLIPVEIIALWAIISGLIPASASITSIWVVFGALTLLVPFYVIFAMKIKKIDQIVLMTLAFPIWILAMGGLPVTVIFTWFEPWMMSVILALFTLVPPMFYGKRVEVIQIPEPGITASIAQNSLPWRQVKA